MKRLLALLLLTGCPAPPTPPCVAPSTIDEDLAKLSFVDGRVVGRPGAAVAAILDDVPLDVDADGAFAGESVDGQLVVDGREVAMRERDSATAARCSVGAPVALGTLPNDLAITHCEGRPTALIPVSGDGALQIVDLASRQSTAVAFPVLNERGANPFHVAASDARALVSLFGQDRASLVDACDARALATSAPPTVILEVDPPVVVENPRDFDGDGTEETTVTQMTPRAPQGVAMVGQHVFVAFTGLLEAVPEARFGAAYLERLDADMRPTGGITLPCDNPQSIVVNAARLFVSCSGFLARDNAGFTASSDGALLEIDPESLEVLRAIDFGRFAPGTPAFTESRIVVGSLIGARALSLAKDARNLSDAIEIALGNDDDTESVFEVLALPGEIALVSIFGTSALRAVDARTGALDPAPFVAPVILDEGEISRGLLAVDLMFADGRLQAAGVLGLSNELVPLDLQQWVGP